MAENTFDSMVLKCKVHKSDIGGLCCDVRCQGESQMKCIKCLNEEDSCTKKYKHKFLGIDDFFNIFFDNYYADLKRDYNTSTEVIKTENYCVNANLLFKKFNIAKEEILKTYFGKIDEIIQRLEDAKKSFKDFYSSFMDTKYEQLRDGLINLNMIINFDALEGYEKQPLKKKMLRMPFDVLNDTLVQMKKSIANLEDGKNIKYNDEIEMIEDIHDKEIISYIVSHFNDIKGEIDVAVQKINTAVSDELFFKEKKESPLVSKMTKTYQSTIDYSSNSNFLNKKFVVYTSITTGESFIAYPSSLNTIKIEKISEQLSSTKEQLMITSNENIKKDIGVNSRDNALYFKLKGHLARINDIRYFNNGDSEYLLSTSEDHSLKLWNITSISCYIDNPEGFYKSENVISLVPYKTPIISLEIFKSSKEELSVITVAQNEKIKVWNILSGECIREIYDRTSEYKGTFESNLLCFHHIEDDVNYLITGSNSNHNIKLWDFDKGVVLDVVKYEESWEIIDIKYYNKTDKIIVIDNIGQCCMISIKKDHSMISTSMNFTSPKYKRVSTSFITSDIFIIYDIGGMIYEYDLGSRSFIDKLRISDKMITHIEVVSGLNNQDLILVTHSADQNLRVFKFIK